jgi:hypothetical protein
MSRSASTSGVWSAVAVPCSTRRSAIFSKNNGGDVGEVDALAGRDQVAVGADAEPAAVGGDRHTLVVHQRAGGLVAHPADQVTSMLTIAGAAIAAARSAGVTVGLAAAAGVAGNRATPTTATTSAAQRAGLPTRISPSCQARPGRG